MLYCYCPFEGCGHKATYEVIRPAKCPRCNQAYSSAFKVAVPTVAPVVRAPVEDDTPAPRLTRSALLKSRAKMSTTKVKPFLRRGQVEDDDPESLAHVMNPPDVVETATDTGDVEDEYVDERVLSRRAQELAASIDPSSIIIADQDEGVVKFGKFWQEGQATRESGKGAPKATKKRGRR